MNSALPRISQPVRSDGPLRRMSGVLPIAERTSGLMMESEDVMDGWLGWRGGDRKRTAGRLQGREELASPELPPKLVLRPLQGFFPSRRKAFTSAVDVEAEHRHGRAVGLRFSRAAAFGRSLERSGNPLRIIPGEDIRIERQRAAVPGHLGRPLARCRIPPRCLCRFGHSCLRYE